MKERPIIFSGPMVRAILDGKKTMTRRVMALQPRIENGFLYGMKSCGHEDFMRVEPWHFCQPGYKPVERLWVKESWRHDTTTTVQYRATNPWHDGFGGDWKSSLFMPRWASRITLEIISVRVERVQEISVEDCFAEGIDRETRPIAARYVWGQLWNSINEKRGHGWEKNPWVWVIEFMRI